MKAQKPNKPWPGPDVDKMAAAFVAAFVRPSQPSRNPSPNPSQGEGNKTVYFDFLAGRPLPLEAFGVRKEEAGDGPNLA